MKKLLILAAVIFVFLTAIVISSNAQTNQCDNASNLNLDQINICLDQLKTAKEQSEKATKPLEDQVNSIKKRVAFIEYDLLIKEKNIEQGYKNLERQQQILNETIRSYYIKSYNNSPLLLLLSTDSVANLTKILGYQKATADRDKAIITNIVISITGLEERQKELESEKKNIVVVKEKLDKIVAGARAYQATLSTKIAQLNAQQQTLIAQRLGNLNIPRSAGTGAPACIDDRTKDPGFSPRLAFFTYGVPNRTGLNQYGAKGRAATQGHEDILRAYYEGISFETKPNINIKVQGYGEMPLETYLLGIYEMPEDWPMEALKAQVIAARSYALAYTNNGAGEICTTQSCQVYKQPHKTGPWVTAVQETAGKVMINGGQVIKAWYSSTHGGYVFSTSELPGWSATSWTKHATDTTTGTASSFSELASNAYDRDSPWFYCDWGSRSQYNKTAWLKSSEAADIVNVILLARKDSSTGDHLYQTDKPHPYGGEVWNEDRVKQELSSRGGSPYNNISSISVSADFGSGKTSSITVSGDGKSESFSGSEFKDWFNLRAPANIQIVGPLYNVEQG
ncbi:MAG: SpoIID/LytB domain-containing protein [Patescibacteria group bacterium]